ncbi:MAG: polysaccharide deacetylase family protein [Oscillospiraceae bacterium]|nr:polysaccharide deacetylase family protein [Oscillospiraceae bacterium]
MEQFFLTNQYYLRYPGFRRKALTLSYDDGVEEDIRLVGLMNAAGLRGTFNLNSGLFGETDRRRYLSRDEAVALYGGSPHEVAVHSYRHPFLEQLPAGVAAWEIVRDREALEEAFGRIIRGMAYPMGTYSDELTAVLRACGIAYARTTQDTHSFNLPADFLRWYPTCRHTDGALPRLCEEFLALRPQWDSKLFYLWGHSYEFQDNGNWDVMERFCKEMGGREDIWYATNAEICDYLEAGRRIQASVDGGRLYNPTATTLYLETGIARYCLEPGSTLNCCQI